MFFLRIAEALIANHETKLGACSPTKQTGDVSPAYNFLPSQDSMLRKKAPTNFFDKEIPALNENKSNSIDGHILRSLIALGSESSGNSHQSNLSLSPLGHEKQSFTCTQLNPSPLISTEKSPAIVVSSSLTPNSPRPSSNGGNGGILYSLLVSSDKQGINGTELSTPDNIRWSKVSTKSDVIISNKKPGNSELDSSNLVSKRAQSQFLNPQKTMSSQNKTLRQQGKQLINGEHQEYLNHPSEVKKCKISNSDTDTFNSTSLRLLTTEAPRPSFFQNRLSNGHRRFSFGGYSAPRSDRNTAILKNSESSLISPILEVDNRLLNLCPRPVSENFINNMHGSSGSNTVLCSNSTPSILSALISSPCSEWSPSLSSASTDSGLDEPLDLTGGSISAKFKLYGGFKPTEIKLRLGEQTTLVQLAKKTARPVQARVTEWLRQASEFVVLSVISMSSEFNKSLSSDEAWLTLFRSTWHRLLCLSMAENYLDVVLVESTQSSHSEPTLPWLLEYHSTDANRNKLPNSANCFYNGNKVGNMLADQHFANKVIQCISDLQMQKLTKEEFDLLRNAIIQTSEQPLALPAMGVKVLQNKYSSENVTNDSVHTDGDHEDLESDVRTIQLSRGLVTLSNLCPFKMANLFCSHLRGETSLSTIIPLSYRSKPVTFSSKSVENQCTINRVSPPPTPKHNPTPNNRVE